MQQLTKAVDLVRKAEHRALLENNDKTLVGSKYVWLYSAENLPARYMERFEELRASDLKTSRAWAIKENLRRLWQFRRLAVAKNYWKRWLDWALRSQLPPIVRAAQTLQRHVGGIFGFFENRVTNAITERINGTIQRIKRAAHGYRNLNNFMTAIFFHCGGLQLYPPTHTEA